MEKIRTKLEIKCGWCGQKVIVKDVKFAGQIEYQWHVGYPGVIFMGVVYCTQTCLVGSFGRVQFKRPAVGIGAKIRAKTHKDYEGNLIDY